MGTRLEVHVPATAAACSAGVAKDALLKMIDHYGGIDEKCWNTGRVSSLPVESSVRPACDLSSTPASVAPAVRLDLPRRRGALVDHDARVLALLALQPAAPDAVPVAAQGPSLPHGAEVAARRLPPPAPRPLDGRGDREHDAAPLPRAAGPRRGLHDVRGLRVGELLLMRERGPCAALFTAAAAVRSSSR